MELGLRHPESSANLLNFAKTLSPLDLGLTTAECAASLFNFVSNRENDDM